MEFKNFKKDVEAAFNNMIAENLFVANVDKDLLWMGYLLSFEDETIRQDHNCNACKSFIRHYGKVVAIDPQTYKVKTFWDDVRTPGLPFDIHGEGYDFEELGLIGTEANLRYFEKVTPNYIDCGTDVDKFINTCLQFK